MVIHPRSPALTEERLHLYFVGDVATAADYDATRAGIIERPQRGRASPGFDGGASRRYRTSAATTSCAWWRAAWPRTEAADRYLLVPESGSAVGGGGGSPLESKISNTPRRKPGVSADSGLTEISGCSSGPVA
jgi:hypothetical protein